MADSIGLIRETVADLEGAHFDELFFFIPILYENA